MKHLGMMGLAVLPLLLSACTATPENNASQHDGARSGWFRPLQHPAGERRAYWQAGLGTRSLEAISNVRAMGDGSRVYTIACREQPPLYISDRISDQYNSPAVASLQSDFEVYATLDLENLAFLENIHKQLHEILPKPRSKNEDRLIRKLFDAIEDARRVLDSN